jgi:hypothetical protein
MRDLPTEYVQLIGSVQLADKVARHFLAYQQIVVYLFSLAHFVYFPSPPSPSNH